MIRLPQLDADLRIGDARWRLHLLLGTALIAMASCWLWATPGPFLRGQMQSPESAMQNALVAFAFLFVFPLVVAWVAGIRPASLGICLGEWKLGLMITAIGIPIAAGLLFFGCDDLEIKTAYPWAGQWLAASTGNMLKWFAVYLLYYIAFEFFFRGFLLKGLEPELGLATAMWIQVLLSVAIHFGKPTPEILGAIPAAFIFGRIACQTNSILYVVLIHWAIGILNDLFAMHFKDWI